MNSIRIIDKMMDDIVEQLDLIPIGTKVGCRMSKIRDGVLMGYFREDNKLKALIKLNEGFWTAKKEIHFTHLTLDYDYLERR